MRILGLLAMAVLMTTVAEPAQATPTGECVGVVVETPMSPPRDWQGGSAPCVVVSLADLGHLVQLHHP